MNQNHIPFQRAETYNAAFSEKLGQHQSFLLDHVDHPF